MPFITIIPAATGACIESRWFPNKIYLNTGVYMRCVYILCYFMPSFMQMGIMSSLLLSNQMVL